MHRFQILDSYCSLLNNSFEVNKKSNCFRVSNTLKKYSFFSVKDIIRAEGRYLDREDKWEIFISKNCLGEGDWFL